MTVYGSIEQVFKSPALTADEETDRINVVVKFNDDETKAVYTDEETEIPMLKTQKGYGVYFGVTNNSQISFEKDGETTTAYVNLGSMQITDEEEVNTLYRHVVYFMTEGRQTVAGTSNVAIPECLIEILNKDGTPFTKTSIVEYMIENAVEDERYGNGLYYRIPTVGNVYKGSSTSTREITSYEVRAIVTESNGVRSLDNIRIRGEYMDTTDYTFSDTSIQIANSSTSYAIDTNVYVHDTVYEIT